MPPKKKVELVSGDDWRKIESIVLPRERIRAQDYTCSICLQIWDEPVEAKCGHIFCASCLGHGSSLACPECRETWAKKDAPKSLREHNKPMFRRMNSLGVRCPHNTNHYDGEGESEPASKRQKTNRGTGDACDWTGNYSDLLSIHMNKCPCWVVPCPSGCGEKMMRKDLAAHAVACPKSLITCPICQDLVKDLDAHRAAPETKDRHLQLLEKKVADLEGSKAIDNTVKKLEKDVAKANAAVDGLREDLGEQMRQMREQLRQNRVVDNGFEWEIKNFDKLCRTLAKGQYKMSPTFHIGSSPFAIKFCPDGSNDANKGFFSCFIMNQSSSDIVVVAALHLWASAPGSSDTRCTTPLLDLEFDVKIPSNKGWGRQQWIKHTRAMRNTKTMWFVLKVDKFRCAATTEA